MNKKLIIGGVAVVATGGLGYLGYRLWQKYQLSRISKPPAAPGYTPNPPIPVPASLPSRMPASPTPSTGARPNNAIPTNTAGFPLQKGSRGEKVKMLQKFLNHKFDAGLSVDGICGNDTEKALKTAGQPNQISPQSYAVLEFAMKNIGLAGQYTSNRII